MAADLSTLSDSEIDSLIEQLSGRRRKRVSQVGAAARGFGDAATFGFGDEAKAALIASFARPRGESFRDTYEREVDASRARLAEAREDRPLSTAGGGLLAALVPGGLAARAVKTGVGLGSRLKLAAGTGAASGAVAGAGSGTTLEERGGKALEGGVAGAVLGAGFQGLGEGGGALFRAVRGRTNSEGIKSLAAEKVSELMDRAPGGRQASMKALEESGKRSAPRMVGEVLGPDARGALASMARAPGETAGRVGEFLTQRRSGALTRVIDAVDTGLTGRTGRQAVADVEAMMRDPNGPPRLYQEFTSLPPAPVQAFAKLIERPTIARSLKRAVDELEDEGIRTDLNSQTITPMLVDRTKQAIDDLLQKEIAAPSPDSGTIRRLETVRKAWLAEADQAFGPVYARARAEWGGLAEARAAVARGQAVLRDKPEEIREYLKDLTPFQQEHFRVGVADALREAAERADKGGAADITSAFRSTWRRKAIEQAFPDEDSAATFLARLDDELEAFQTGNRIDPEKGSITSNVLLQQADIAIPDSARAGLMRLVRGGIESQNQRLNDEIGRVLASPASGGALRLSEAQLAALREAFARRQRRQLDATRGAVASGLGFGQGSSE